MRAIALLFIAIEWIAKENFVEFDMTADSLAESVLNYFSVLSIVK